MMFPKPPKRKKEKREGRARLKALYQQARMRYFVHLATVQGSPVAMCEACGDEIAAEIHHTGGRVGDDLLDESKFMGVCPGCSREIHANPEWAYENGYLIRRNDVGNDG